MIATVIRRELKTVIRTPTFALLTAILTAVAVGIAWFGGGVRAGYVPTTVDLLTPFELLVPVVAVAFGYRAILGDRRRGELDVLATYPVTGRELVVGTYLGRAIGLVAALAVPLTIVMVAIVASGDDLIPVYATHRGADSPILFVRFAVLTVFFAATILAVAVAVSAIASGTRSALALAVVLLIVLLVGLDLALVYGFTAGLVGDSTLIHSLAISPLSAYRGLVLETTVSVAAGAGPRIASPVASVVGLCVWTIGSLAVAAWAIER